MVLSNIFVSLCSLLTPYFLLLTDCALRGLCERERETDGSGLGSGKSRQGRFMNNEYVIINKEDKRSYNLHFHHLNGDPP
jgi:hypothetical protein